MKLLLFFVLAFTTSAIAQPSDYWQQHVSYQIEATLLDSIHSLEGKLQVVYTNNSPDTLREIYFHLYNNAFRPGSMMHKRAQEMNDQGLLERLNRYKSPADWGGYTINKVNVNGNDSRFIITGTVMKVTLAQPLAPEAITTLSFNFFEQIPRQTRRNGWMNSDSIVYSMAQCYPKVCAYDREGWHNQEYIGREFYGVWGEFDVKLTVPAKYCVGATGQVQNPDEVQWGYEKIAKGEKKGVIYPKDYLRSGDITWHFKASNVHDFAWVAHNYIHEWDTWSDTVTVHCLYKSNEEKEWKQAMKHTFAMLEHHSKAIGWYQYRNFYNTHSGDGGMEYPQLIMDMSPNAGLIMHEGAHQWFYGMLGSNETRYAFLDEGFTEFLEMVGMEWYYDRHNERSPHRDTSWLTKMFIPEYDTRRNYYSPYLNLAADGYEEPLNIPHDWAREGVNAGQVYFKTLNGLAQLEYVLGDSVFWVGMKEYFRRWCFKSPNLNDFKRTMEDVSSTKLDWYFDQWFHTTRTIDYSACGVSSEEQPDGTYKTTVELYNNDLGVMPIDLTLRYEDGSSGIATIPLAMNQGSGYQKPESGRLYFPSWDWVSKKYEGTITTPKEVDYIEIDSSYRLMDINQRGNTTGLFPKTEWSFLKQYHTVPNLAGSYAVVRPIVWYDNVSKMQGGVGILFGNSRHTSGDIKLIYKQYPDGVNDLIEHFDAQLKYSANVKWLGPLTTANLLIRKVDDIFTLRGGLQHIIRPTYRYFGPTHKLSIAFEYEYADMLDGSEPYSRWYSRYPIYHSAYDDGFGESAILSYSYNSASNAFRFKTSGVLYRGESYSPVYADDEIYYTNQNHDYINLNFQVEHTFSLLGNDNILLRYVAKGITGTGTAPTQRLFQLNRANNSEELDMSFFKAISGFGYNFSDESSFYVEGGAGVRGYSGSSSSTYEAIGGTGAMGFTAEFGMPSLPKSWGAFLSSFEPFAFFDAGYVGTSEDSFSQILSGVMTNAGIGLKVDLLSWLPWQTQGVAREYSDIPTMRIDIPFYMNHPYDGDHFAPRFTVSLGTTF